MGQGASEDALPDDSSLSPLVRAGSCAHARGSYEVGFAFAGNNQLWVTPGFQHLLHSHCVTVASLLQDHSSSDLLKTLLGVDAPLGASVILALALPVAHVLLGFLGPLVMLVMDALPALSGFPAAGQRRSQTHPSQAQISKGRLADPQEHSHGRSLPI